MSLPRRPLLAFILLIAPTVISAANAVAEIPLAPPRFGPSSTPSFRFGTAVASNGHGYLVAWEARKMEYWPPGTIMIRAFDEAGRPLQPVATALGGGVAPSIAWNGREYLVVFGELGSRFGSTVPLPVAVMTRIAEDGTPIDQTPVVMTKQFNSYTRSTSVAWNGTAYLVCWSGNANGAALVTSDLQTRVLDVSAAGAPVGVASNGGGFLVAAVNSESGELRLAPVSASGQIGAVRVVGLSRSAALTAVDGDYELLWSSAAGLQAARVTSDLHPATLATTYTYVERIASVNGTVVASWVEYPHKPASYTSRVCTERLDIASQPVCSEENKNLQHDPAIGVAADTFFLAWSDRSSGIDDIRIDVTSKWTVPLASGDARIISEAAAAQGPPAIERRADGGIVAVWSESNSSTRRNEVRIGGLDPSGAPLPDRAIAPASNDQSDPQLSTANGRSLVVWREGRFSPTPWIGAVVNDGNGLTPTPFVIAADATNAAIAFDGSEWLVASIDNQIHGESLVRFVVVDLAGRITRTGSIDVSPDTPSGIAVAANESHFVMAWSESGTSATRILTAQITVTGPAAWQPTAPILLDETPNAWTLYAPTVAVNANRILVTWSARAGGAYASELREALLDVDGARIGGNVALPWRHDVYRSRSRPGPGGFVTLASTGIVLTSLDGMTSGIIDLSATLYIADILVDGAGRFTIAYDRAATVEEKLGETYRAFIRYVEPTRGRALRMR